LKINFYTVKGSIDILESQGLVEDVLMQGIAEKTGEEAIEAFLLYR
jgi:hypothetical protein